MIANLTKAGDYWGIDFNHDRNRVLIQLTENDELISFCEQVRLALTREEAEQLLEKLKCTLDFIKD